MNSNFKQDVKVLSSMTDANAEVGLSFALSYLQDNMCEYFFSMGCDGISMIPRANCFWVMTKTKIKFNNKIKWLDRVTLETDLIKKSPARLVLANNIIGADGCPAIEGIQEICAMDSESRKIRLIKTTLLPEDIEVNEGLNSDMEFGKMEEELGEDYLQKNITIDSRNIDYFGHTNNVEYVKIMLSTFDAEILKKLSPKTFEIHYIHESRYGENLSVYRKEFGKEYLFEIKCGERVVCKSRLTF